MNIPLNLLPGFEPTDIELVRSLSLPDRVQRGIKLLQAHEPGLCISYGQQLYWRSEGYYLGFSGGKDSQVIEHLAKLSGVQYEPTYNNTTIDAGELVRFIKQHYPYVKWNNPKMSMMKAVAELPKTPPTRNGRWCCELYKENGGAGRIKILGVRAEESPRRRKNWREVSQDMHGFKALCPVVFWLTEQIWDFIKFYKLPYCSVYDEGWGRMGCVGCPLQSRENQAREFARWPRYRDNWRRAIIANWEKWHNVPRKDGKPRYQAKLKSGEDLWQWWLTTRAPDYLREECQSGLLWTNHELDELNEKV